MTTIDCFHAGENVWFSDEDVAQAIVEGRPGPFKIVHTKPVPEDRQADAGHIQFVYIEDYPHPISAACLTRQLPLKASPSQVWDTGHLRYGEGNITAHYPFKGR